MPVAECHQAQQHGAEIAPALRRHVFVARRMRAVLALLQHPGLDQRGEPRGQDVRRDAETFAEFLEAGVAMQRVAQDQDAPPFAHPLQAAGDRTVHLLEAFPAHGATVTRVTCIMQVTGRRGTNADLAGRYLSIDLYK